MEGRTNFFAAPTGCQEPGLLNVWKSLKYGVIWNGLMAWPDWPWPPPYFTRDVRHGVTVAGVCRWCRTWQVRWRSWHASSTTATSSTRPAACRLCWPIRCTQTPSWSSTSTTPSPTAHCTRPASRQCRFRRRSYENSSQSIHSFISVY